MGGSGGWQGVAMATLDRHLATPLATPVVVGFLWLFLLAQNYVSFTGRAFLYNHKTNGKHLTSAHKPTGHCFVYT